MEIIRFYFDPNSPLHLGNGREEYSISERIIHSDTLYAAITAMWFETGAIKEEYLKYDFTISSLFPFTHDQQTGETVYFFPKPFLAPPRSKQQQDLAPGIAKKYKKIQYYDRTTFERFLAGQPLVNDINDTSVLKGAYLTEHTIDPEFIHASVRQRVQIPRDDSDAESFYMEELHFKKDSGLYCIIEYDPTKKEAQQEKIREALGLLQENGIGTDRNIGYGRFLYQEDSIPDLIRTDSPYFINLSLFSPQEPTDAAAAIRYQLLKRGGWITHQQHYNHRKKSVYFFSEGSVFYFPQKKPKRFLVKGNHRLDLTPNDISDFKVLRVGKSLFLPVQVNPLEL